MPMHWRPHHLALSVEDERSLRIFDSGDLLIPGGGGSTVWRPGDDDDDDNGSARGGEMLWQLSAEMRSGIL